jgi:hypothetical protein
LPEEEFCLHLFQKTTGHFKLYIITADKKQDFLTNHFF